MQPYRCDNVRIFRIHPKQQRERIIKIPFWLRLETLAQSTRSPFGMFTNELRRFLRVRVLTARIRCRIETYRTNVFFFLNRKVLRSDFSPPAVVSFSKPQNKRNEDRFPPTTCVYCCTTFRRKTTRLRRFDCVYDIIIYCAHAARRIWCKPITELGRWLRDKAS